MPEADRPATITLGALIEIQRERRAARQVAMRTGEALPAAEPGDAWQAQLGAFGTPAAAERQRTRLAGLPVVVRVAGGLHRLESVPSVRAETEALCRRAAAAGVDCFVKRAVG
ncbi:MAG: SPOR domain-containing protein [Lysobacteraceae bacterium]|nr:MAG: SPOR domain-containing protein [Xanthomonadaceae bacterium]